MTEYDYDIYQNSVGVVRRELAYMTRNPSAEVGREIRLVDYPKGVELAFDKHRARAVRYQLQELGASSALGERRILGYLSVGTRYDQERPGQGKHVVEVWVASDISFKEPLLRVECNFGRENALETLTIRNITQVEEVSELPESLFAPPGGLEMVNGPPGAP